MLFTLEETPKTPLPASESRFDLLRGDKLQDTNQSDLHNSQATKPERGQKKNESHSDDFSRERFFDSDGEFLHPAPAKRDGKRVAEEAQDEFDRLRSSSARYDELLEFTRRVQASVVQGDLFLTSLKVDEIKSQLPALQTTSNTNEWSEFLRSGMGTGSSEIISIERESQKFQLIEERKKNTARLARLVDAISEADEVLTDVKLAEDRLAAQSLLIADQNAINLSGQIRRMGREIEYVRDALADQLSISIPEFKQAA